ncbi:Mevalonate/phosphomevalonate kinase [Candidatus Trichorickettsia mobilis]|uniref:Mevalonate/phosphomevalonate kinase n=1 Tax=Candidatus Trichorickettsia mobilis TaxID=1346319 RepID=A0ABZ0UV25_9RICK|nr:hypothetical protein [Candidatus Trichorickettsia mobilis]WPY01346.1 Mevalonate/phosphomevalonate kinase [Candidatus Trichorickettsia mobilis]
MVHIHYKTLAYTASAPGTLMLLGEHSVLENKRAIVLAIDKRINVTLTPRQDMEIIINSDVGKLECNLDDVDRLKSTKSFEFVLTAISLFKDKLISGFELLIISNFSSQVGLGSSAAITVSTLAVLQQFSAASINIDKKQIVVNSHEQTLDHFYLFQMAKTVVKTVQGIASGADVAASVHGGIILYQQTSPYILKQIPHLLPLVVIYSGYKTPTPEVIKKVKATRQKYPKVFAALDEVMDQSVLEALTFIEQKDWLQLGAIMNIQQGVMNAFGVGTSLLNELVDILNGLPGIYGAKISGSGLGDCVIGLGEYPSIAFPNHANVERIFLSGSLQGVCYG